MRGAVYVAGPVAQKLRVAWTVGELVGAGVAVCSTWHRGCGDRDPADPEERRRILDKNRAELRRAALLVVLSHQEYGRSMYCEIGEAASMGLDVVWSRERGGLCLYEAGALVHVVDSDDDVPRVVVACLRVHDEDRESGVRRVTPAVGMPAAGIAVAAVG